MRKDKSLKSKKACKDCKIRSNKKRLSSKDKSSTLDSKDCK